MDLAEVARWQEVQGFQADYDYLIATRHATWLLPAVAVVVPVVVLLAAAVGDELEPGQQRRLVPEPWQQQLVG